MKESIVSFAEYMTLEFLNSYIDCGQVILHKQVLYNVIHFTLISHWNNIIGAYIQINTLTCALGQYGFTYV